MRKKSKYNTPTPEVLAKMAEMWKHLHDEGTIDCPFDQDKFDFLTKLFAGKLPSPQQKDK